MESIKALNWWLNDIRPSMSCYRAFSESGLGPFGVRDGVGFQGLSEEKVKAVYHQSADRSAWIKVLEYIRSIDSDPRFGQFMSEYWTTSGVVNGVKLIVPSPLEYRALTSIEVNVPITLYRQPYDTVFMAVPSSLNRIEVSKGFGTPLFCIARHSVERRVLGVSVWGTGKYAIHCCTGWEVNSDESAESFLHDVNFAVADINGEDHEQLLMCARAIINACMIMAQSGTSRKGFLNPEYAAKLESSLKKKNLPETVRKANSEALKMIPMVYGFDQHVKLFDREDGPHDATGTGAPVRPHWRRGHWAQQAHGPKFTERKLIFRRPVLVNSHRFAGDLADTRVTMTVGR